MNIPKLANNAKLYIDQKTNDSKRQLIPFGVIFFVNYPLYYIIWTYGSPQGYENLPLRISASLICVPLILYKFWPNSFNRYLSLYWYFAATFCIPFFFTFMTLKNEAATAWMLNLILAMFLTFLLFDLISMTIITFLGALFAYISFSLTSSTSFIFNPGSIDLNGALATFLAAFVIGAIFNHNRDSIEREKLETIKSTGASMAHELRTPLRAISANLGGIRAHLPSLIETYTIAKDADLHIPYIASSDYKQLNRLFENAESETKAAFTVIDMLLIKADLSRIDSADFKTCSIAQCIDQSLQRYAFDTGERKLVDWQKNDFKFYGDELLMIHVLFNLFKNAIYYVKTAGSGEISLWCEESENTNILQFKDTGTGISSKSLPYIFDRFYSKTTHGTGVGLAFCKMVMQSFGGDITCQSKLGKYTQFTLNFPKEKASEERNNE